MNVLMGPLWRESIDDNGCSYFEKPIPWNNGPYSTEYMGTTDDFTIPQPINENLNLTNNWVFKMNGKGWITMFL